MIFFLLHLIYDQSSLYDLYYSMWTHTLRLFIYQSNYCLMIIKNHLLKMILIDNMPHWFNFDTYCVITSKWVHNLIQQAYYKFAKIFFLYTFCRPMKKRPKFEVSLQPPRFTIYSLMVFPFKEFLTDNLTYFKFKYVLYL